MSVGDDHNYDFHLFVRMKISKTDAYDSYFLVRMKISITDEYILNVSYNFS